MKTVLLALFFATSVASHGTDISLESPFDSDDIREPEEGYPVRKVLMVIDMQNDYCGDCDKKEEASYKKWEKDIQDLAKKIGREVQNGYDLIVLTQDMLDAEKWAADEGLLQKGTSGYEVVGEIWNKIPDNVEFLTWAKDTDDWFIGDNVYEKMYDSDFSAHATLNYVQWNNKRHFDLEDTNDLTANTMEQLLESRDVREEQTTSFVKIKGQVKRLHKLDRQQKMGLERYDFKKGNTEITVAGIMLTRCVMKGAIHAVFKGWKVHVREDLTDLEDSDPWYIERSHIFHNGRIPTYGHVNIAHAPPPKCEVFDANGGKKSCEKKSAGHDKWMVNVFSGHKHGPPKKMARDYFLEAGVGFVNPTTSENNSEDTKNHSPSYQTDVSSKNKFFKLIKQPSLTQMSK